MTEDFMPAKPCPKCGCERVKYHHCFDGPMLYAFCPECGFEGPKILCPGLRAMMEEWNALDRGDMPEPHPQRMPKKKGFWPWSK